MMIVPCERGDLLPVQIQLLVAAVADEHDVVPLAVGDRGR
jgi:hypothetical protein